MARKINDSWGNIEYKHQRVMTYEGPVAIMRVNPQIRRYNEEFKGKNLPIESIYERFRRIQNPHLR